MAKLVVSFNATIQGEYPLNKEHMSIGRKSENDVQINNLAVSGKHALVITILDDSFLEDLGSTNGTYVNGKLIKKHALKNGDVISIGKHELKYLNEHASADSEDYEKTMVIPPGAANQGGAFPEPPEKPVTASVHNITGAKPDAKSTLPLAKLQVLNGPRTGRELELLKPLTTLGKPGVQVAVISRRPKGYFLTHIESNESSEQKFPLVNGDSIGTTSYELQDNDIVELVNIKMEFSRET